MPRWPKVAEVIAADTKKSDNKVDRVDEDGVQYNKAGGIVYRSIPGRRVSKLSIALVPLGEPKKRGRKSKFVSPFSDPFECSYCREVFSVGGERELWKGEPACFTCFREMKQQEKNPAMARVKASGFFYQIPDKSTETPKSIPGKQPSERKKVFDLQPLENQLNEIYWFSNNRIMDIEKDIASKDITLTRRIAELEKKNLELEKRFESYEVWHTSTFKFSAEVCNRIDALEANQTTKSWVKALLSKMGMR